MKICPGTPDLVRVGQKCRALYVKAKVRSTVAGDIKSPENRCLPLKWYRAFRVSVEV
jgi:hypothetical protein